MKRTFPTNIDGQIFYIDEDAFILLQNYLQQLKITFTGTEGEEIVSDIESRIRELFNEKVASGASVIVVGDVEKVIETMGRPEDLTEGEYNVPENEASSPSETKRSESSRQPFISINRPQGKKLYRDMRNKVFGGVFGGLATYLGWNANIMRLLYIVLVLGVVSFIKISPLILIVLYLIVWMIIPPALTPRQILQMNGTPVNIDTVGQAVMAESGTLPPPYKENINFFTSLLSVIGKCIIGFIGFVSGTVTIACFVVIISLIIAGIVFITTDNQEILSTLNAVTAAHLCQAIGGLILAILFAGWVTYGCILAIFNIKPITKNTALTLAIVSAMLAMIAIILLCIAV